MKRLLVGTAAAGLALGLGAIPAGAQEVQTCPGSPVPVSCVQEVAAETFTPEVAPQVVARQAAPQTLPVTGGDVVGLAALGLGAVAGGAGLLAIRRRKTVDA